MCWENAAAVNILCNCRLGDGRQWHAARRRNGRAPRNAPSPGKFLDSEMLLLFLHSYLNASS